MRGRARFGFLVGAVVLGAGVGATPASAAPEPVLIEVDSAGVLRIATPPGTELSVGIDFRTNQPARVSIEQPVTLGSGCERPNSSPVRCVRPNGAPISALHVVGGELRDDIYFYSEYGAAATLDTRGGDDVLISERNPGITVFMDGPGRDQLRGSDRSVDYFVNGPGPDLMLGGGVPSSSTIGDVVDYSARTARVRITNGLTRDNGEAGEGDLIDRGVSVAIGGSGHDVIVLESSPFSGPRPRAVGNGGNDRITASGADDFDLFGGPGDDRLEGGEGYDNIVGGDGDDVLKGRAGNDILDGGRGADKFRAGPGDDVVLANGSVPAADDGARDRGGCGSGDDRLSAGPNDYLRDCEIVAT